MVLMVFILMTSQDKIKLTAHSLNKSDNSFKIFISQIGGKKELIF